MVDRSIRKVKASKSICHDRKGKGKMRLDLLVEHNLELSSFFKDNFSKINFIHVCAKQPLEAQVSEIEGKLSEPSIHSMLIYSDKYRQLGTVLSRRYVNSARIHPGPLRLADITLLPDHISCLPNGKEQNRVLFLAPHFDETYLAAVMLHRLIGDDVFLNSFTYPKNEKNRIRRAYQMLCLKKDDYLLGSLQVNELYKHKEIIGEITRELLAKFNPTVVVSIFPRSANYDHISLAQVIREVVLNESKADLVYGYVIQSRNNTPMMYPLFPESVYRTILKAFGRQGLGRLFERYLLFLKHYMNTYSEPLLRLMGEKKLSNVYSLPLEAERIRNYRIPVLN